MNLFRFSESEKIQRDCMWERTTMRQNAIPMSLSAKSTGGLAVRANPHNKGLKRITTKNGRSCAT